ncbi:MAG: competence type IV pilus minor pilin ComGF, partial [Alkalibacterium sp.]|uniref:competence type IV pilus minor pilin ComGF n=2 Tax=Alkalibacterium sp. TaxID=1872447 RepID=UPI003970B429
GQKHRVFVSRMVNEIEKQEQGFSLLEVIITLSIISSCVLLFSLAISQIGSTRAAVKDDRQIEWHLFVNQLEFELTGSAGVRTSRDKLVFEKFDVEDQKMKTISYERYYKIIRRQVGSKGHQPILLEVSSIAFSIFEQTLAIDVVFSNGETYSAQFRVNEEGVNDGQQNQMQ